MNEAPKKKRIRKPKDKRTDPPKTPRQLAFLEYYMDPKSPTFGNALQSALRAGFKREYAEVIRSHAPKWLSEKIRKRAMLSKAERNLDEFLDLETKVDMVSMFGPVIDKTTNQPFKKQSAELLKIKSNVSMFVSERIGKGKWSTRKELTGKGGSKLLPSIINIVQPDDSGSNEG